MKIPSRVKSQRRWPRQTGGIGHKGGDDPDNTVCDGDFANDVVVVVRAGRIVEFVGDVKVSRSIHRQPPRICQLGEIGRAAVAGVAIVPRAHDSVNDPRVKIDAAHDVIARVGKIKQISRPIHRHAGGLGQIRECGLVAVTVIAVVTRPCNRSNQSRRRDLSDGIIVDVREIDAVVGSDGEELRVIQSGSGAGNRNGIVKN